MSDEKFLCPICESVLIEGTNKKYLTWADDVVSPDLEEEDIEERPTLDCSNKDCVSKKVGFFDISGDFHYHREFPQDILDKYRSVCADNKTTALYGLSRQMNFYSRHSIIFLNIFFFKLYLTYEDKLDPKYGRKEGYNKFKLNISKRDKNGSYCVYSPWFVDLFKSISFFYDLKKEYYKNPTEYIKKELYTSYSLPTWEKRIYRRLTIWYLSTFEKKLFVELKVLEELSK